MIKEPSPPSEADIKNFKEKALAEIAKINDSEEKIFCDEECPELTDEQLSRLMPVHSRKKIYRSPA